MTVTPEQIRINAEASYQTIRNNPRASAAAIKADIGQVFLDAKAKMADAQQAAATSAASSEQADMRTAFGAPTDPAAAMSFRDACDRASAISSPLDAKVLLTRAVATNDSLLAQALGLRAFDLFDSLMSGQVATDDGNTWGDVLQGYADYRGDTVANAINRLLKRPGMSIGDPFGGFLSTPKELTGMHPYQIQRVIEQVQTGQWVSP